MLEFRAERGRAARDERRRVAARSPQRASLYAAREKARDARHRHHLGLRAAEDARGLLPGARRHRRTRSPSRSRPRRSPTSSGWRPRRRTSHDAREFAEAIHAEFPDKMLAYNLSPSFNWDTTGMSDEEMRRFPEELGKLGFVFNFITYGGHQIDGLAAEEFATALKQDGMLALARLQRKLRLRRVALPDAADARRRAAPRRRARWPRPAAPRRPRRWARARPSSSTSSRPRCPPKLLEEWLAMWREHYELDRQAARPAAAAPRRLGAARARHLRRRRARSSPTSSSRRSRTAAAAASSRCATRTPSTSRCARSG